MGGASKLVGVTTIEWVELLVSGTSGLVGGASKRMGTATGECVGGALVSGANTAALTHLQVSFSFFLQAWTCWRVSLGQSAGSSCRWLTGTTPKTSSSWPWTDRCTDGSLSEVSPAPYC